MKYIILGLVLAVCVISCGDTSNASDSATTELEGSWVSDCKEFTPSPGGVSAASITMLKVFKGNNVSTYLRYYSDNQCVQYITEIPASDFYLSSLDSRNARFYIGNSTTLNDGTDGTEIDFILENSEVIISVFQLQDNDLTLVFGVSCGFVAEFLQDSYCTNGRPMQIDVFSARFTKI